MLTRKHFVAKAAEFARVLPLCQSPERRAAIMLEIEQYMDNAKAVNGRFDSARFRAACGLPAAVRAAL